MKLFRLIYRDEEYGYDCYEGLFKTKESLLEYVLKEIECNHSQYILKNKNDCLEIIQDENNETHYYIKYTISNFPNDHDEYGLETFVVGEYEYEIMDTDDLM